MSTVIILTQPQSVFVDENSSAVTFSTSGTTLGTTLSDYEVAYQWYQKDALDETFIAMEGEDNETLVLTPLAEFDNDSFKAGLSAKGVENEEVFTQVVTFAIRLSGDEYNEFETPTETGANRVRRLFNLGYI